MYVFIFGILIGVMIGVVIATVYFTINAKEYRKFITEMSIISFAERLKAKVNRPEYPWEDSPVCESDIDEVLKEMVGER